MKSKFGQGTGSSARDTTSSSLQSGLSESGAITESRADLAHDSVGPDMKPMGTCKKSVSGENRPGNFRFR